MKTIEIIGREEEKEIFQELLESKTSEFLAVYGRRRIGKTFLIEQFFKDHLVFHNIGLTGENQEDITMAEQLDNFWLALHDVGYSAPKAPTTWLTAFGHLAKYIKPLKSKKKKVIFLDEIPWMETPRSMFLSAFGNFWNKHCANRPDIILVICGSSASWILNKIVLNSGGLHNRLTRSIHLQPFTLKESKMYLLSKGINLVNRDLTTLYMAVGGVPYYLNGVKKGKSIDMILNDLFFVKNAYLKDEFNKLFRSLFKKYERHLSIIKALNSKRIGLTRGEIAKVSKIESGGNLTDILDELIACGFISVMTSFGKKSNEAIYRLVDEYTNFYFQFLSKSGYKTNQNLTATQEFKIWSGYAFENLCLRHVDKIAKVLGFSGIAYSTSSFILKGKGSRRGAQIDLIIDRADNCINLIEIKFHTGDIVFTESTYNSLLQKIASFENETNTKKNIFLTLVTSSKAIKNKYYLGSITNEVQLDNLIN